MSSSSKFDSETSFNIRPGLVSAFYFVLFDLILISIIDTIMSRAMSYHYNKTAFEGRPLRLRSADLPGVTTFLIGDYLSKANVAAVSIKLMLLAAIFTVDLKINAAEGYREDQLKLSASFKFNASDALWGSQIRKQESVAWRELYYCQIMEKDAITYYSISFNLTDNDAFEKKLSQKASVGDTYHIDYRTAQCLKPGNVAPNDVDINARVLGCSNEESSGCSHLERTLVTWRTPKGPLWGFIEVSIGLEKARYWASWCKLKDLQAPWSVYQDPTLFCIQGKFGINSRAREIVRYSCLLVAEYSIDNKHNGTLVEHWTAERFDQSHNGTNFLDDNFIQLKRDYPGPVFEGKHDIGSFQKVLLLHRLWNTHNRNNWATLSGIQTSSAAAYTPKDKKITKLSKTLQQTTIPVHALVLFALIIVVSIIASAVICFKFGFNYQPELININRLALLAKERHSSSIDSVMEDSSSMNLCEAVLAKRVYLFSSNKQTGSSNETDSNDRTEASSTYDHNPFHGSHT